jgi:2-oxoglutarate ferredoxin oxidoreductase subunit gamma
MIISGFGGQGIVAGGRTIAYAGLQDEKTVSMLPSYGPEMRGGFANCRVILSDREIASPVISMADVVVAMSLPAFERFQPQVKPGKYLLVDSYQVQQQDFRRDIQVFQIPTTKLAMDLGHVKFANMVMIGAMMEVTGVLSIDAMTEAVKELLPKEKAYLIPQEMKALYAGMDFIKQA